ncbi:MAG: PAS domain S-box protein [Methylocystaceae bacterium]
MVRAFYLSPVSMAISIKADGRLLEVNHGFCRATGYRPEDILGKSIDDMALFIDLDGNPLVNQLVMGNEIEVQYRTCTGAYRLAMLAIEEFHHQDETYRLASFADITPRKLMEVELRKSKEQLQQIISASPAPICVSALHDGRYMDVNESFLRVTGYSRDEVIGKTIEEINYLVGVKRKFYVDKLLAGEPVNNLGIVVRNRSGEIGYSLLSAQIYMVDDLPCVLSTVIDITERKLTEQALAESEARFHSAFHFSPTMMIITRADTGKIIDANTAWLQTMGYNVVDVIGRNVGELNTWVDDDRHHIVRCIEETGRLDATEVRVRTANGQILYTLTSAVQTSVNNELCVLTYSVDITEQKRIQKELARLDRLNLVGQMAASLGHEVRNPMTTVRGFLQIMQDQEGNLENQEYYKLMIEELDQGNKIISEYLALASDKKVDLCPCNLNSVLEQIYPLLRAEALLQEKWINYHLADISKLLLDEKEIRQLIINIANNGLDAMAPGGCLEISTTMEYGQVVLAVTDQGEGIDPSLVDRLGTPFLTTKKNGVGLGLAICYSIAQRHGASIDFASHDHGTTFRISFKPYLA